MVKGVREKKKRERETGSRRKRERWVGERERDGVIKRKEGDKGGMERIIKWMVKGVTWRQKTARQTV